MLARHALPNIKHIYQFSAESGINHRILAYYRSVSSTQAQRHGLYSVKLVPAYKYVFPESLASERATPVDPIRDHVRYAVRRFTGADSNRYIRPS